MKSSMSLAALALGLGLTGAAWSMGNIDNTALINGAGGSLAPPGLAGNASSVGETFTTDASASTLLDFSLSVRSLFPTPGSFKEYIGLWNGSGVSSILWTSTPISFALYPPVTPGQTYGFYEVEANVGGLALAANTTYIAFLSAVDFPQPSDNNFLGGLTPLITDKGGVPGGNAFLANGLTIPSSGWISLGTTTHYDYGFEADFGPAVTAPVPEPETYALMLVGLGLLGHARRRSSQRHKTSRQKR